MDIYTEQLYDLGGSAKNTVAKIFIWIVAVILSVIVFLVAITRFIQIVSILFLLIAAIIYLAYLLCAKMNIEYEYIMTGDIIDIDKIVNKKRRRRLMTFNCGHISGLGELSKMPHGKSPIYYCRKDEGIFVSVDDKLIVFAPNEQFRAEMASVLPHYLKKELENAYKAD